MDSEEDVQDDDVDDDEPFEMQLNDLDYDDDHHFRNHHSSPAPRQRRTDKDHKMQQQSKDWPLTWWPQLIPAAHHTVTVNDRECLLPTMDTRRRRPNRERCPAAKTTPTPQQKFAPPSSIDDHNSSTPSPLHNSTTSQNDDGY